MKTRVPKRGGGLTFGKNSQKIQFFLLGVAPTENLIFSASGFNQFGLYHDDALQETPEVKEALSRLPQVPSSVNALSQSNFDA